MLNAKIIHFISLFFLLYCNLSPVFYLFFLVVLYLHCCVGFSLAVESRGCSLVAVNRLIVVASLVAEHRLCGEQASIAVILGLSSTGKVVLVHGLSCSVACGTFQTRVKPMSPALADGFFTTEPTEKPCILNFYYFFGFAGSSLLCVVFLKLQWLGTNL